MRLPRGTSNVRDGLTLLEVLVALAIFLLSLGVISHMITLASERALEAQHRSRATQLCQSKLAEVQAGALPLSSASGTFEEDAQYSWTLAAEAGPAPGLWAVSVRVSWKAPGGVSRDSSLSQLVLDPTLVGSTQDTVTIAAGTDTPSSTGSSTGSSSSTGATGGSSTGSAPTGASPSGR